MSKTNPLNTNPDKGRPNTARSKGATVCVTPIPTWATPISIHQQVYALRWRPAAGPELVTATFGGVCLWSPFPTGKLPTHVSVQRFGASLPATEFVPLLPCQPVTLVTWSPCGTWLACAGPWSNGFKVRGGVWAPPAVRRDELCCVCSNR